MTDHDRRAIQRVRAQIGPEHRGLTNDEIRDTRAFEFAYLGLAIDALHRALFAGLAARFRALAAALDPTPPEDQ